MRPKRAGSVSGPRTALKRKSRPCAERPSVRTSANSRPSRMRAARGNRSFLGFGVAGEVDFDTLRKQALATALAAAIEDGASVLRLHAGAETKLLLAGALAGLIGAFHKLQEKWSWGICRLSRESQL